MKEEIFMKFLLEESAAHRKKSKTTSQENTEWKEWSGNERNLMLT